MHFCFVLATVGRVQEVGAFLDSLTRQTFGDFSVVLVDQNADGRLDALMADYANRLSIKRVASAPGLSKARNVGLAHARGDVIGFPDDDCVYPD